MLRGADVFKRVCDCNDADRRSQTSIQVKFQKKARNAGKSDCYDRHGRDLFALRRLRHQDPGESQRPCAERVPQHWSASVAHAGCVSDRGERSRAGARRQGAAAAHRSSQRPFRVQSNPSKTSTTRAKDEGRNNHNPILVQREVSANARNHGEQLCRLSMRRRGSPLLRFAQSFDIDTTRRHPSNRTHFLKPELHKLAHLASS